MPDRNRIYHGVSIGILMLDTRFERFNGDIGNARTWPFPVQYRVVRDATPNRVTRPEGPAMLDAFKAAADEMIDPDPVAHRPQDIDRHAPRILADHFEIVGEVAAIGPLPDPPHADHPAAPLSHGEREAGDD